MGDIVNKNDRCSKPENELDNYSSQCSSVDKSISDFIKSVESIKKDSTTSLKYSSRDSGSSDEMHITTSSFKNKNKIKMSPIYKKTSCNNRKNINSQLYSSTPLSNSEHSVNGITEHISKRIEQLQKHLVKSSAGKLSIKQLKKYEKDINSSNQKKFKSDSDKKVVLNILKKSVNIPSIVHFSTIETTKRNTFQENRKEDYKDQNEHFVKNQSIILPSTNNSKSSSNHNVKLLVEDANKKEYVFRELESDKLDLMGSKISLICDSDDQSPDDNNYTKLNHHVSKHSNIKYDFDDKIIKSTLITKKRKTFQSNNKKDCKKQIENMVVTKQSSTTSDSESSSNENIILPVKGLDQKKNVNHEPEINKFDLTESKICMSDSDDQSSSNDTIYTKLKYNISKPYDENCDLDSEKLKHDNSVNVHSSSLSSKKRKTFQSNDKKECNNQIINKFVQRQSSSTSDSESSSNENIILPVKDLDQKKNVNREPEINKLYLKKSNINIITDSEDQSSSDDDNYTKLKQSILKQDDIKSYSDDKKFKLDNSVNVHSSSLSSKKRKTFQSNDKKECNNQIINKFVQRQSSSTSDSDSSSSNENIILPVKDLDQKKNVNCEPEINKLYLKKSNINIITDSEDQSSSDDDNYTKLKQSILKQDDIKSYSDDKKFKLDNSVNVHSSSLSSKNRISFQSNDKKECNNQIINKFVQRQSSTTSDSESSSNENIILPVKGLDQKKNVNREPEINKLDLTESKICMSDSDDQSSSNDAIYTKLKLSLSKPYDENCDSDREKLKHDNSVNVHSSSLSSKKRKTFQSKDKKACNNQIINKFVQRKSSSTSDSESSSNENIILPVKDLDQKKNVNREPDSDKLGLTESRRSINDSNDQSSSDDVIYTKLKHSISKPDDKKLKLDNSVDIQYSNLTTKKKKTFKSNDKKDFKNQIINKVIQRQSTSTSDSESSSNENIIQPVKNLDQKKNLNYALKINEVDLTESKISIITDADDQSSSDDDMYIKHKHDVLKQVNRKPYITNQSYNKVNYLNGVNDSLSYFVHDEYTPSSKLINSNIKESFIKIAEIDTVKIDKLPIEKTSKKNKKQKNSKCTLLKSPKDNKSLIDLMKITNNKDILIKKILEEDYNSSNSSVGTDNELEFLKKNVEKQRLNKIKNAKLQEISIENTSNKQSKTVQKLDSKITKHQIATLGITDDLSSRKRKRSGELTKDLLLDSVLNSLQDSSSCHSPTEKKSNVHNSIMKTNNLTEYINYNKSSSEVKKKKKSKHCEDIINVNDLIVKNNINQINDSLDKLKYQNLLVQEKDSSEGLEKNKHLKSDSIQCDTDITINDKLGRINNKPVNINLQYTNIKSSKKQSKIFSADQIKNIISIQDTNMINNLDNLYRSLNN